MVTPNIQLISHRGVKPYWDDDIAAFLSSESQEAISLCGAADGYFDLEMALGSAVACAKHAEQLPKSRKQLKRGYGSSFEALFEIKAQTVKGKAFIDPQHDVTTSDIRQAKEEGFVSVEHMKRYTTLGMATDQERNGNVLGIAVMAEARKIAIPEVGITTFRPPFTPVSIGALAGRSTGHHWQPVRRTPMHDNHLAAGA